MAKSFACGEVVEGCKATFTGANEGEVLAQVAKHAKEAHNIPSPPPELVEKVKSKIKDA